MPIYDDGDTHEQSFPLQTIESRWKQIFDRYDVHKNGQVPITVLRNAIENSNPDHLPPQAVSRILEKYDSNNDDCISFPEFLDMMKHEEGRRLFRGWMNTYIHHTIPHKNRSHTVTDSGEYEDKYSCCPPPVGMFIISLFEILFFVYDTSVYHESYVGGPLATVCIYNPRRRKEAWRFLSYMFVHNGPMHLTVNLLIQILLGVPLEMVHGWFRILIIYFSGVIAGSLGTSVSDPYVWLAGASGGVYAILAAHLATIIMNWSEMQYALWQLAIFLVIIGYDVGNSIYQRYVLNVNKQIGYVAHFTGALAGLLVGLRILRNLEVHRWEKMVYRVALVLYFILMTAAILWNIFEPEYYPKQDV